MPMSVGGVSVDLTANAAQIVGAMNQAATATLRASGQMNSALKGLDSSFRRAEQGIVGSFQSIGRGALLLRGAFAALLGGIGVRQIVAMSDAWVENAARLKLVTGSAGEAANIQGQLLGVANQLGVTFDGLATIYTRTAQNAGNLGLSQSALIDVTTALAAAIRISGTSAQEAQGALFQLSQSFASGVLRGEELNSISEQLPPVLDAVAKATGKTRQEVITFAKENGLAADLVIEAVRRQKDAWQAQAAEIPMTFSSALAGVTNSFEAFFGRLQQTGLFKPLIDSFNSFAVSLNNPAVFDWFANFVNHMNALERVVNSKFDSMVGHVRQFLRSFEEFVVGESNIEGKILGDPDPLGLQKQLEFMRQLKTETASLKPPPVVAPLQLTGGPAAGGAKIGGGGGGRGAVAQISEAERSINRFKESIAELRTELATVGLDQTAPGFERLKNQTEAAARAMDMLSVSQAELAASPQLQAMVTEYINLSNQIYDTTEKMEGLKFAQQQAAEQAKADAMALADEAERGKKGADAAQSQIFSRIQQGGQLPDRIDAANVAAQGLSATLTDLDTLSLSSLVDSFANIAKSIAQAIIQALIFRAIMAAVGAPIVPGAGIAGKASGGPVQAGHMYRVGNEFFSPAVGGDIMTQSQVDESKQGGGRSRGGGDVYNIYADTITPGTASRLINISQRQAGPATVNQRARRQIKDERPPY